MCGNVTVGTAQRCNKDGAEWNEFILTTFDKSCFSKLRILNLGPNYLWNSPRTKHKKDWSFTGIPAHGGTRLTPGWGTKILHCRSPRKGSKSMYLYILIKTATYIQSTLKRRFILACYTPRLGLTENHLVYTELSISCPFQRLRKKLDLIKYFETIKNGRDILTALSPGCGAGGVIHTEKDKNYLAFYQKPLQEYKPISRSSSLNTISWHTNIYVLEAE